MTQQPVRIIKVHPKSHIGRQFLRWSKYWMNCKDPEKREQIFNQARLLGEMLEKEQKERTE